jgi:alkyl hydroperoxide reductase subunit F
MNKLISNSKSKIFIFTKSNCAYCKETKKELQSRNLHFESYDVTDNHLDCISCLKNQLNYKTFPMIFVNNNFIGGYDNLVNLLLNNKLFEMLDCPVDF